MPIHEMYIDAVAKHLNKHAVWEPGATAKLGDYGVLHKGTYEVIGTIADVITLESMLATRRTRRRTMSFATEGVRSSRGGASGSMGEIKINFSRARSLWVRGSNACEESIENVQNISSALLESANGWNPEWLVTFAIESASSYTVLLNEDQNSEVVLRGPEALLRVLDAEGAADASIELRGDAVYSCIGRAGPLFRKLFRVKRGLLGRTKLSFRSSLWEEVPARAAE